MTTTSTIYHERQAFGRQLCACHALNNLLQARLVTPADFFGVARSLGGAAQSSFFWGNFDVNVLQQAALEAGIDLSYFDVRKAAEQGGPLDALLREGVDRDGGGGIDENGNGNENGGGSAPLAAAALVGLLLNVPSRSLWGRLRGSRHWLALVPVDKGWTNLDSMLAQPQRLGGVEEAAAFLRKTCLCGEEGGGETGGGTLLVARRQPVTTAPGGSAPPTAGTSDG